MNMSMLNRACTFTRFYQPTLLLFTLQTYSALFQFFMCFLSSLRIGCELNLFYLGSRCVLIESDRYEIAVAGLKWFIRMHVYLYTNLYSKICQQKINIPQNKIKLQMSNELLFDKQKQQISQNKIIHVNQNLVQIYYQRINLYNNTMQSDKIFYVLPNDITYFHTLNQLLPTTPLSAVLTSNNSQAIINALKYRFPLNYLGKQAQKLIVLCIPAKEHQTIESKYSQNQIPLVIKTNKQTNNKGYKSGRRSAIVQLQGKLIRYKGCGNDGDGFIYENQQLRGSHFYHTAKRELYMTNLINQILQTQTSHRSANQSLFFYQFPQNIQHLGLKNDIRLLNKYCCVFETKGDRRVGTHLISPLQIIFLNVFDANELNLEEFFTKKQRLDKFGLTELLIDFELFLQNGQSFLQKYDQGKQFENYVHLSEISTIRKLKHSSEFSEIIDKIAKKFINKQNTDLSHLLSTETNWILIIQIILQKLGWQMGQIKRIFCQKGINWGFFNDHNMWHCNAHLNNFVIQKPQINQPFILPLDFDLAFTKDEFINIDYDSEKYGQPDNDTFQQFLLAEYNAMQTSISGVEIMNFKYGIDLVQNQKQPTLFLKMLRVIFRDTLINSFRKGMKKNNTQYSLINKKWNQNIEQITKLVQSCLKISAEFQT